jgi:hypothetical protein
LDVAYEVLKVAPYKKTLQVVRKQSERKMARNLGKGRKRNARLEIQVKYKMEGLEA